MVRKGKTESLGRTNLDLVETQPLGEADQFFCLLHAPHLSAAALNDLVRGTESPIPASSHLLPSTSPLPLGTFPPRLPSCPPCSQHPGPSGRSPGDWTPPLSGPGCSGKKEGKVNEILHCPEILRRCGLGPALPNVPFRIHRAPKMPLSKAMRPTAYQLPEPEQVILLTAHSLSFPTYKMQLISI